LAKMKELRGETSINGIAVPVNGKVPYYIPNTDAGRAYAYEATELTNNPFPITKEGLARGKELYNIYCGICHGEKGDGNGWLARDDSPYNAGPTNYLTDDLIDAKNGRYYHVIMHGKGVMGAYKDKISHEERWQVIHWIRALQAKEKKMVYNEYENTLNNWATPYADTDGSIDLDNSALAKDFKKLIGATATTVSHDDHSHGHETHDGHGHADDYGHEGGSHAEPSASLQLNNVFFDTGKASLKAESKTELNTLAALLKTYATVSIQVAGHTDSEGADDFNMTLSDERAASVTAYLEAKGIESSRITSVGYGETKPVSQNVTEEGRAKNRRTEFSITSK
ncbi:MAG: OmpA family protein, partial [Saprospiraceae bacterium]